MVVKDRSLKCIWLRASSFLCYDVFFVAAILVYSPANRFVFIMLLHTHMTNAWKYG